MASLVNFATILVHDYDVEAQALWFCIYLSRWRTWRSSNEYP